PTILPPASSTVHDPSLSLSFLYCDGPPLPLHSFPTRRSSDLPLQDGEGARVEPLHPKAQPVHSPLQPGRDLGRVCARRVGLEREDRKSTRLNSSHRTISYAVFCLKKKTKYTSTLLLRSVALHR